jgi:uncharacterized flavoprotein (TIGR03862 family)
MAAEAAAGAGCAVTVYDQMRQPGRKFLLAGRGGLNLTHSEPLDRFLDRYSEGRDKLAPLIAAFPPEALRAWADGLGAETFIGTSGRVFPRAMKASPLLRAWLQRLAAMGVRFEGGARMSALSGDGVTLQRGGEAQTLNAGGVVLALGGASWPELGSDGRWTAALAKAGVPVTPFEASNAGFLVKWEPPVSALAGAPLKGIAVTLGWGEREADGKTLRTLQHFPGEAVLSARGLEGGAVYAANAALRAVQKRKGEWPVRVSLDLKPSIPLDALDEVMAKYPHKRSLGPWLMANLNLSQAAARLVSTHNERSWVNLAFLIKCLMFDVTGFYPIERAISSAGGAAFGDGADPLAAQGLPGVFLAGEMLDWDAPTGGYLLQACFATGRAAGLAAAAHAHEKGG